MPVLDGIEATIEIKKILSDNKLKSPIVACTAYDNIEIKTDCL